MLAPDQYFIVELSPLFFYFRDPRRAYENINRVVRDVNIRLQNWDILIKNIRAYYSVSKYFD